MISVELSFFSMGYSFVVRRKIEKTNHIFHVGHNMKNNNDKMNNVSKLKWSPSVYLSLSQSVSQYVCVYMHLLNSTICLFTQTDIYRS